MFKLQEIFDDLAHSEFSNMAVGRSQVGTITEDRYPQIVSLINAALLDIYTRFAFSTKEFVLQQIEGVTDYYIRTDNVGGPTTVGELVYDGTRLVLEPGNDDVYIAGAYGDPTLTDIIQVQSAFLSDGRELHINNYRFPEEVFMPEMDRIRLAASEELKTITMIYQSSYPRILIEEGFDPEMYPLHIPRTLKAAIQANVVSRFLSGKTTNAAEGQRSLSSSFWYKFEAECTRIEKHMLLPAYVADDSRFSERGWV